jgi:ectoine hydroxylase-related dioxygenase (phytanoyl-CoA dioxygenase family)
MDTVKHFMDDLANYSKPIGDLFDAPVSKADWEQYRLTDDQVQFFNANGYLEGVRILTDDQIEQLRTELTVFFEPDHAGQELWYEYHSNESADPDTVLFHSLGAWRISKGFHDLLWHPAFVVPASQLLGGTVRMWHDQLFCKPAKHGGVVAWHQDYSYWTRTTPMAHLTCWIGLDDSNVENGSVHYVPGSHQWPLLPITGLAGDMEAIKGVLNDDQWEQFQNPVATNMKAGEAVFHHPLMVHGSFENKTNRPRRATVINVVKDGVQSQTDEPLLKGADVVPIGEPLGGKFYPTLFDPSEVF